MRLYLDNSVLNRPFDDQRQGRIWLETLSFSLVLSMVENGEAEMVVSPVQRLENSASPSALRREWVDRFLKLATIQAHATESIRARAKELESVGLKALDALHISSAEAAEAEYFLTCDDRLAKRYKGKLKVVSPQEFVSIVG
jgi:predicted nucleic acid-binding protein